jgi:hypothetical protein
MRESRTYGSVRGARGNSRPYREVEGARQSWRDPAGACLHPAEADIRAIRGHSGFDSYRATFSHGLDPNRKWSVQRSRCLPRARSA